MSSSRILLALIFWAVTAVPLMGQFFVSPAGDDGNDCLSPANACATIQAAVDRAPDGSQIQVAAGTYSEQVGIGQRQNLTIEGEAGAILQFTPGPGNRGRLIRINQSQFIRLSGLTLKGNGTQDSLGGIGISSSEGVAVFNCTLEDLGGGGIAVFSGSLTLVDSVVRRCRFHGIRVDGAGQATLLSAPFSQGTTVLEDNLFTGVILNFGGKALALGGVVIQGNRVGVLGEGGIFATCCGGAGGVEVRDNVVGISLRGGHLELRGPATIEGNSFAGVRLNGASGSFARFSTERVMVTNNGTAGDLATAGVFLTGSHLDLFRADVTGNPSRGVLLQDNSSVRLFDASITDNGAEGLRIEALSSARIFSPTTVRNNRGFDLSCTPNSFASGDKSEIGRIFCGGFDQSPSPGPPEPHTP